MSNHRTPPFKVGDIVQLRDEYRRDWRVEIVVLYGHSLRVEQCRRGPSDSGYLVTLRRGDNGRILKDYSSGFFEAAT